MFPSSRRTLVQALTVSLLIHSALLLSVLSLVPLRLEVPAPTLSAVISRDHRGDSAPPASTPASTPATTPPTAPAKPSSPVVRKAPARQIVVAEKSPAPLTAPPAESLVSEAGVPAPASSGAAAGGGVGSSALSVGVTTPAPAPAREGVSADDLRQYRMSLARAAKRFKRYPALARERGWEGTAEVALNFDALLPGAEIVLVRSSGRSVLDEQALALMAQAARVATVPEGMRGRGFRVQLPVIFSLEDSQ